MNARPLLASLAILTLTLAACGTLEVGMEKTPAPPATSVSPNTAWAEHTDPTYRVSLRYPAHWQPVEGYPDTYGGPDGFFQLSAIAGIGQTLGEVCRSEAYHQLLPYGSHPEVENVRIGDLFACRILPSDDQIADMNRQAAMVFVYPQPVRIGEDLYHFFILRADKDHLPEIVQTLRFTVPEPTVIFNDLLLGIAFDIPATWQVDSRPGAEAQFTAPDETGVARGVLTLSVLSEGSTTLDGALDQVRHGAWGPFIDDVQPTTLGEFPALRVEMTPEGDRPSVVWLIVAPSGRAVSFIPRGDPALAEMALVTLRAVPISSSALPPDLAGLPPDLPSGLVLGTESGLWKVDRGGVPTRILDRLDAFLSPDGTRAVYADESDLWLIDLTTGDEQNLTSTPDLLECCPQWWPARPNTLVYGVFPSESDLGPSTGLLTVMEIGHPRYLVVGREGSGGLPGPGPDGDTIAFDQVLKGYLFRWSDGRLIPLDPASYTFEGGRRPTVEKMGSPSWSPDGRYLAWVLGGDFGEGWRLGIGVFDLRARTARLLHSYEPLGVGGWPGAAVWSPDGAWLAYVVWPAANPDEGGLYVLRSDGSEKHHLGPGSSPVWSPDGRWLAFRRGTELWLAEVGTWVPRRVASDAWPVEWLNLP